MKYNELHKLLRKAGCYKTGGDMAGHPVWYSPRTGLCFPTSHHLTQEVARGTLRNIKKSAGI